MYLDGNVAVGENSQSIKERRNLSQNGYLEITLILSNSGKLSKPVISYRGIPENSFDEKIIFEMEDEIFNTCRSFSMKNKNKKKILLKQLNKVVEKLSKIKLERNLLLILILQDYNAVIKIIYSHNKRFASRSKNQITPTYVEDRND